MRPPPTPQRQVIFATWSGLREVPATGTKFRLLGKIKLSLPDGPKCTWSQGHVDPPNSCDPWACPAIHHSSEKEACKDQRMTHAGMLFTCGPNLER